MGFAGVSFLFTSSEECTTWFCYGVLLEADSCGIMTILHYMRSGKSPKTLE